MTSPTSPVYRAVSVDAILPLRHAVLRPGRPREEARFKGDDDPGTRHLAAVACERVIACASVMAATWEGKPAWQLRGMATEPAWRGRGVGRGLLGFAEAALRREAAAAAPIFWCNARVEASGFYLKQGWAVASECFEIPGVGPHYRMIRAW